MMYGRSPLVCSVRPLADEAAGAGALNSLSRRAGTRASHAGIDRKSDGVTRPLHVLFLQGPPSRFWRELADRIVADGGAITRVNLALGDALFWRRPGALNYRGRFAGFASWLDRLVTAREVTDIVYYGDRFPYHRVAAEVAAARGIRCHAIEFGYLRPDWLTLERQGMGGYSHFPSDPAAVRLVAGQAGLPDRTVRFTHSFGTEAFQEVSYHLLNWAGRPLFPFYRADRYYQPVLEYLSWLPQFMRSGGHARHAAKVVTALDGRRFFLVAMQLQSDYQIRANSAYRHLSDFCEEVIGSFARHAARTDRLVFKEHPLDNGLEHWDRVVGAIAARHGVGDRVDVINGGDLNRLIAASQGVIVVNSTVGLTALMAGTPVLATGAAVYAIDGLTHQRGLDTFWTEPQEVDTALAADFVAAIAATIQVRGSFYDPEGRRIASEEISRRLRNGAVNEPGGFEAQPPRLPLLIASRKAAGLPEPVP
jgi:capsular polysaccharide export protein